MTRTTLVAALLVWIAVPAYAQGTTPPPIGRLEVAVGGGWFGGARLGSRDAALRGPGTPSSAVVLFATETELRAVPSLDITAGWRFSRRWGVEGGVAISHPELRTSVTADAEGAPPIAVAERIDQYVVEGRFVVLLEEMRLGQRTVPFVTAGAGYLRQLHEGLTFIEEGHVVHVGGGLRHALLIRPSGLLRALGLRVDARLYLLSKGVAFDDDARPHGAISGAVTAAF